MSMLGGLLARSLPYVPKRMAELVARRYIAGDTLEDGLRTARQLNLSGFATTMDLLGEDTTRPEQARRALDDYLQTLNAIERDGIDGNVSVKPTQFGLRIDPDLCLELFRALARQADSLGHFVRVEMEDSTCTDRTLELYRRLRTDFDNVGIVLQSCLFRTGADLERMLPLKPNVRLVKGVYIEPPTLAWQDRQTIRDQYMSLARALLGAGSFVAFATHDEYLVDGATELVARSGLAGSTYEFQMLLGVREPLRDQIRDAGHTMRVYVPFGSDWYPYSMRRLRENPRVAGYVIRAMLGAG